jgi:transcriptional regulator with AAA-type ATPase domain
MNKIGQDFNQIIKFQHIDRFNAIHRLKSGMLFHGMNSILVIGDTGTGKTHWINKIAEYCKNDNPYLSSGIINKYSSLCEESEDFWEKLFEKADKKVLLIEEVDKLTKKNQEILFDALSTSNGTYGIKEKKFRFILIFTTILPINKLRDDRNILTAKFFDRISQIVVRFPNFDQTQTKILVDFKATWDKMNYDDKCPDNGDLINWLEGEAYRMHGNFRDLDKIVVNWKLYRTMNIKDDEILGKISKDFDELLHNPAQKAYEDNIFVFDPDSKYDIIIQDFRAKLKAWSMAFNNGSIRAAAKMLNISHRTMERW